MIESTLCYLEQDGKYLMLYRNKKKQDPNAGKWIGVGGKLEAGETPEECVVREVREETGYELTEFTYRGKIVFWLDPWEDEITYLFTATGFRRSENASSEDEDKELSCEEGELRWVPFEEIPGLSLWEGDRYFLGPLMEGKQNIDLELKYQNDKLLYVTEKPSLTREGVTELMNKRFLNFYDLSYAPGRHYFVASRHELSDLVPLKSDREFKQMQPDAVGCVVILECEGEEPRLLLLREMRYPTGQFLLGVPAGLLDAEDAENEEGELPIYRAAKRELLEETGIAFGPEDSICTVNPFLFSSPGMTDESNAMVQITIRRNKMPEFSREGNVGGECIGGFCLYTKQEAKELLSKGTDETGIYYSVYTWLAFMTFVSGLWS